MQGRLYSFPLPEQGPPDLGCTGLCEAGRPGLVLPLPPHGGGQAVQQAEPGLDGCHAQVEEDRSQQPGCIFLTAGVGCGWGGVLVVIREIGYLTTH